MKLSDFSRYVPQRIYDRGYDYWKQGRVTLEYEENGHYEFDVEGSETYFVEIDLNGDKVADWQCDCPYDGGSICKHVVACLLYLTDYLNKENPDNTIDKMQLNEQIYLCFLAYVNPHAELRQLKKFPLEGMQSLTATQKSGMEKRLYNMGWLKKDVVADTPWRTHTEYNLNPDRWIEIIKYLYTYRKEWIAEFSLIGSRSIESVIISGITIYLLDGTSPDALRSEPAQSISNECWQIALTGLEQDESGALPSLLPPWLVTLLLLPMLRKATVEGDIASLEKAKRVFDSISDTSDNFALLHSMLRRSWFFYKGELLTECPGEDKYPANAFTRAALLLLEGDTAASIEEFRSATKLLGKSSGIMKGLPDEPISLFLYICALSISSSEEDLNQLSKLVAGLYRSTDALSTAFYVLGSTILGNNAISERMFRSDMQWCKTPISKLLSSLAYIYAYGGEIKVAPDGASCALLENEIRALAPGYDFKGLWLFEPLLPRIHQREKWEAELDRLISLVAPNNDEAQERLIYYCSPDYDKVEIRIQGKLKNGGQSRGRALSAVRYNDGDCPMDATDKAIKDSWNRQSWELRPSLEHVIPFCAGTDKLLTDSDLRKLISVEVTQEKAYIRTERSNGRIHFSTNIPSQVLKSRHALLYEWSRDRRHIKFWPMDKQALSVLNGLLALKSVPQEAEPMLEKLISPLQGKLEVQSDIRGGVRLESREGSPVLCVRISPDGQNYSVTVLAHPLEDGSVYLVPGQGSQTCVDGNKEGRYEVKRNLRKEKSNLRKVLESLDCSRSEGAFALPSQVLSFLESLPELSDICYLEWPQGKPLHLAKPSGDSFNISAVGKGGWFELEGELRLSEDAILSIAALLELSRGTERYIKISDGEYMLLSDEIRRQIGRLEAVSQTNRGKIAIPELAMSVIADSVGDVVDVENGESLANRKKLIVEASKMDIPLPDGLNAILRPYQEDGFRWMMRLSHWGAGACLADDMGLGKTVQSIAFLLAKSDEGPQMVVAPASVIGNWENELHRFAPTLKLLVLNEMSAEERYNALKSISNGTVVITTYGVLVSGCEHLTEVKWATVILDEAHTIKNRDTKMSASAMKLSASNRIILTGTPIQNHLGELWNLFRFINPGLLGSFEHF